MNKCIIKDKATLDQFEGGFLSKEEAAYAHRLAEKKIAEGVLTEGDIIFVSGQNHSYFIGNDNKKYDIVNKGLSNIDEFTKDTLINNILNSVYNSISKDSALSNNSIKLISNELINNKIQNLQDSLLTSTSEIDLIIEDAISSGNGKDQLITEIYNRLSKDIMFDSEVTEEQMLEGNYSMDKAELNPTKKIGAALDIELSRLEDTRTGNDVGSEVLKTFHNSAVVKQTLFKNLINSIPQIVDKGDNTQTLITAWEQISKSLDSLSNSGRSEFGILKKRLENNPDAKNNLVQIMMQSVNNYVLNGIKTDKNDAYLKTVTSSNAKDSNDVPRQLLESWNSNLINNITRQEKKGNTTENVLIKEKLGVIKELHSELNKGKFEGDELINKIIELYNLLGIKASRNAIAQFNYDYENDELQYKSNAIKNIITTADKAKKGTRFNINPITKNINSLKKLAEIVAKEDITMRTQSVRGADGKSYYPYSPSSFMDDVINEVRTGNFTRLEQLYESPIAKGNEIIRYLLAKDVIDPTEVEATRLDRASDLSLNKILYAYVDGIEKEAKELDSVENQIRFLNNFTLAYKDSTALSVGHEGLTPSDKSSTVSISGIKSKIFTVNGSIFDSLTYNNGVLEVNKDIEFTNEIVETFERKVKAVYNRASSEISRNAKNIYNILEATEVKENESFDDAFQRTLLHNTELDLIDGYNVNANGNISIDKNNRPETLKRAIENSSYDDAIRIISEHLEALSEMKKGSADAYGYGVYKNQIKGNVDNIKATIKPMLTNMVKKELNFLLDNNIISINDNQISSDSIFAALDNTNNKINLEVSLIDGILDRVISTDDFITLFHGDLAFYKNPLDMIKRVPSAYADGKRLNIESMDEMYFNAAIIRDAKFGSAFLDEMKEGFRESGREESIGDLYANGRINKADGWAVITPNRFRFLMQKTNKWGNEMDDVYHKMLNDPFSLTETDWRKVKVSLQSLKGVYYNSSTNNELGGVINQPTFFKYSQFVLLPGMSEDSDKLLAKMDPTAMKMVDGKYVYTPGDPHKDSISEVIFKSGIKAGGKNITKIFDDNGNIDENFELIGNKLSNTGYKLQQDLPFKGLHPTDIGSQIQRQIFYGLSQDPNYEYTMSDGTKISANRLLREFNRINANMIDNNLENTLAEFGLNLDGTVKEGSERKFINSIIDQIRDNQAPQHIQVLLNTGDINVLPVIKDAVVKVIASKINKAYTKKKTNGGALIQASGVFANMYKSDRDRVLFLDREFAKNGGKPKIMTPGKDRSNSAEVLIPFKAIQQIFPKDSKEPWDKYQERFYKALDQNDKSEINIDPKIFEGIIGYRIPTQSMSSMESLKVVGILPPTMGDTIVLYDEIVVKTGSDFDIDKMFVMMPEYSIQFDNTKETIKKIINSEEFNYEDGLNFLESLGVNKIYPNEKDFKRELISHIEQELYFDEKYGQTMIDVEFVKFIKDSIKKRDIKSITKIKPNVLNELTEVETIKSNYTEVDTGATNEIKPGVSELFESNPELANEVYEALGYYNSSAIEITDKFIEDNLKAKEYQSAAQGWYILQLPNYLDNNLIDIQSIEYAKILLKLIENNDLTKNDGYQLSDKFSEILNKAIPYLNDITKRVVGIESKLILNGDLKNLGGNKETKTLEFFEHINTKSFIEVRNIIKKFAEYTLNPQFSISKQDKEKTIILLNNFINKYSTTNQITPQQKQQAIQLYSQYLDTIFPDSKMKDIVYHGTGTKVEQFEIRKEPLIHFGTKNAALHRGSILNQVLLNIEDLQTIKDGMWFLGTDEGGLLKELLDRNVLTIEEVRSINSVKNEAIQNSYSDHYGARRFEGEKAGSKKLQEILQNKNIGFEYVNISEDKGSTSFAVPSPEQIHILGSKQDIEGFKEFVGENNTSKSSNPTLELSYILTNREYEDNVVELLKNSTSEIKDAVQEDCNGSKSSNK